MSKTILITGTSSGFGFLTALELTAQGHNVFASMRAPEAKNSESSRRLKQAGIHVVELDVTDNDTVQSAVSYVHERAGKLDVLINNAGFASAGISEAFSDQQVAALFDVNVIGVQRVIRAALPIMRSQSSGLIINIGSILGRVTFPFFGLYGASKFALEALTDGYRYELSQMGIDVVLVQPSAFPTSMYLSAQQPSDLDRVEQYGEVADIPNEMLAYFMETFNSDDAPEPKDVAKNIAAVIARAPGERPHRLVVGESFGANAVNQAIIPIQQQTVDALGLAHLEQLRLISG